MRYRLTRYEQETIINFNAESETLSFYTADPVWIRKLDKLVEKNPDQFKVIKQATMDGVVIQKWYEFPRKLLTVRSKFRTATEEQRAAAVERYNAGIGFKSRNTASKSVSSLLNHSEDS